MDKVHRLFLAYLALMAIWQGAALGISLSRSIETASLWYGVMSMALVSQFLVYGIFVRAFLGLKSAGALIWLGAAVTIPLALLTVTNPNGVFGTLSWNAQTGIYTPNLSILATVLSLPYFTILVHSGILLYRTYLITDSAMERSRLRYLMAGLAAILIGILSNLSSSLKQYPIDVTAAILNAGLIAYAIFRYQLLDVSLVIRKGLIYSITTLTLGIAYFLVLSLAINLIHISLGSQVFLLSLLLAVAAALVAEPVRVRLQSVVDRLFFRESYDSSAMLQRLSRKAATLLDLDELGKMILDDIQKTMHIRSGVFLIKHSPSGNYVVRAQAGLNPKLEEGWGLVANHPIVASLRSRQANLTANEVDTDPEFKGLWMRERRDLDVLDAALYLPLVVRDDLIGILGLATEAIRTTLYRQ